MRITNATFGSAIGRTFGSGAAQARRQRRKAQPELLHWTLEVEAEGHTAMFSGHAAHAEHLVDGLGFNVTRYRIMSCEGTVVERLDPNAGWREVAA